MGSMDALSPGAGQPATVARQNRLRRLGAWYGRHVWLATALLIVLVAAAGFAVLQAVGNKFLSSSGLSLENTVDHVGDISDSGVLADMDFAGKAHYGFDLTFRVTEKG